MRKWCERIQRKEIGCHFFLLLSLVSEKRMWTYVDSLSPLIWLDRHRTWFKCWT